VAFTSRGREETSSAAPVDAQSLAHVVHAMHQRGELAELSREHVEAILYALRSAGHEVPAIDAAAYNEDFLMTTHNADFQSDPRFVAAYERGIRAVGGDYGFRWRVHVGLWAASCAIRLEGDFVECGVNRGFMSSAIMRYLDWNSRDRRFFLLDTFRGLDLDLLTEDERRLGKGTRTDTYDECFEEVRANFSEFRNVVLIRGSVPGTLSEVDTEAVAYLHIDMNNVTPEIAAIEHYWPLLVPGAIVLLDDYGSPTYEAQKEGMDEFASRHDVEILSLPTGQGMLVAA
jgi:Macrocin-O-methyltransferase (TylF)